MGLIGNIAARQLGPQEKEELGFRAKRRSLKRMLEAKTTDDCRFALKFQPRSRPVRCYGPSISYSNHPDAPSPDVDTDDNDSPGQPNDTDGDGRLPTGDTGLWREYQDNEACAAAVLDSRIASVEANIDTGIYAMASLMCHATKEGQTVPTDGTALDLTSIISSGYSRNNLPVTVSNASIRIVDESYVSELAIEGTDPSGNTRGVRCRLRHKKDTDAETYKGKLSCIVESTAKNRPNCDPNTPGGSVAFSVSYERAAASTMTYEAKSAEFCGTGLKPWIGTNNYTLDSTPADNSQTPPTVGWAGNFNLARFSFDPQTNAGQYIVAWQAGATDSHSRILGIELSAGTDNSPQVGCAYFGYGPKVNQNPQRPEGMICNWAGPGNSHELKNLLQRQCVTWDATQKLFLSDSSQLAITYAPTNECSTTGLDSAGNPFTYSDGVTTVTSSVTHNLVSASDASSLGVSTPEDIDE